MRSGSLASIAWAKDRVETPFEIGPVQVLGAIVTCNGLASSNVPFARRPGSLTVSVASPAVLVTVAVVLALYSRAIPGTNAPNVGGDPSVNASVAGTAPPTVVCVCEIGSAGSSSQVIALASAALPASLGCRWSPLS